MKVLKISALAVAVAMMATACGGEKTTVEATDAQEVQEASGAEIAVNPAASSVEWVGYKDLAGAFQYQHTGTINISEGTLTLDGSKLTGGKFVIDMQSIECTDLAAQPNKAASLVGHLKSNDFFGVVNLDEEGNVTGVNEANTTAVFEITGVSAYTASAEGEEAEEWSTMNPTHNITGNLTMRGTTKSITFPANVSIAGDEVSATAKFHIDRTKWGITYSEGTADIIAQAKDDYIRSEMGIGLSITSAAGSAEVADSDEAAESTETM